MFCACCAAGYGSFQGELQAARARSESEYNQRLMAGECTANVGALLLSGLLLAGVYYGFTAAYSFATAYTRHRGAEQHGGRRGKTRARESNSAPTTDACRMCG